MTKILYKKTLVALVLLSLFAVMVPVSSFAQTSVGLQVAALARAQSGRPFELGGETTRGFDASGLLSFVFGRFDIPVPRTVSEQFVLGERVGRSDLLPGDIVLFTHGQARWTGLYVGGDEVVWASRSLGRVRLASLNDAAVRAMVVGARRVIPVPQVDQARAVILTAEQSLGVPYLFGAEGPEAFDCSGFTQWVFAARGITLPRTSRAQALVGRAVSREAMKMGDILVFVNTYREGISHVGIYIGEGRFIHAVPRSGVSYASLNQDYWNTRLHSIRRVLP